MKLFVSPSPLILNMVRNNLKGHTGKQKQVFHPEVLSEECFCLNTLISGKLFYIYIYRNLLFARITEYF